MNRESERRAYSVHADREGVLCKEKGARSESCLFSSCHPNTSSVCSHSRSHSPYLALSLSLIETNETNKTEQKNGLLHSPSLVHPPCTAAQSSDDFAHGGSVHSRMPFEERAADSLSLVDDRPISVRTPEMRLRPSCCSHSNCSRSPAVSVQLALKCCVGCLNSACQTLSLGTRDR